MAEIRKPESWETSAGAPFLTIDSPRGEVAVWSLGQERFLITGPGHEQEVVGYAVAQTTAHELADQGRGA